MSKNIRGPRKRRFPGTVEVPGNDQGCILLLKALRKLRHAVIAMYRWDPRTSIMNA